ncbi:hypothetical protein [Lacticaseibacillus jixiensis]|uniref:hypothetical protein n=1 Tax=Lacticaseibacillus jixiensis TaxID=3231926 RepID=UPI0036F325AF
MKRKTLYGLELIILFLGMGVLKALLTLVFTDRVAGLVAYILWILAVGLIGHYTNAMRVAQLRRLWGLADQLGYGPAELKQRAPQYGTIDWALSRPEQLQFYPSDRIVARLCDEFTLEVAERSGVC